MLDLIAEHLMDQSFSIVEKRYLLRCWTMRHDTGIGCTARAGRTIQLPVKQQTKNIPIKNHIYISISYVTCHVFIVPEVPPLRDLIFHVFVTLSSYVLKKTAGSRKTARREATEMARLNLLAYRDAVAVFCVGSFIKDIWSES